VVPLKEDLTKKTEKLRQVTQHAKDIEKELNEVNIKYDEACKAILKTQGLVVTDLESHSIFKVY
jgi:uncharacterized protein YoxC